MALPISIGEVLSIIKKGIDIYQYVKHDVPNEVADVAERIEDCQSWVRQLQKFIDTNNALMKASQEEKVQLQNSLTKLKEIVSDIVMILEKYKNNAGPWGLVWNSSTISKTYFSYSGKPEELERLGKKLDRRQQEIGRWQDLIRDKGMNILVAASYLNRSPSPGPKPRSNILFVDPRNVGRSVMAEAYAKLCQQWTIRSGGVWPIRDIHSSGVDVKSRSNTTQLQHELGLQMYDGDKPPLNEAMSALFNGLPFKYAYKDIIRNTLLKRKSRGLNENLFASYDFILVFNNYTLAHLEKLREALAKKHGQPAPPHKGKLVLLGQYGNTGYKEIWSPKEPADLEKWTKVADNIKASFLGFLKQEFHWTQPAPGAIQQV